MNYTLVILQNHKLIRVVANIADFWIWLPIDGGGYWKIPPDFEFMPPKDFERLIVEAE